jgi:hypothetical protein
MATKKLKVILYNEEDNTLNENNMSDYKELVYVINYWIMSGIRPMVGDIIIAEKDYYIQKIFFSIGLIQITITRDYE